jgi:outer membrane murein-binding lipoprotein Lpp
MKTNTLLLMAGGVLLLAGCSTPTKVDKGPIQAQSFSFVSRGPRPARDYTDNRAHVHAMIHEAITKNLANRGISRTDAGGDITVGYMVIVGNNASTEMVSDYFGYGDDAAALQDKAHAAYTGVKTPNYFEAGTLLIDITDSKRFKLLKRGYASRPVLKNLPEDAKEARIQEVVDEILKDVRFAKSRS